MSMAAFQEALARLRVDFIAQLPARMALAQQWMAEAQAAPGADGPLAELHRFAHTMAGTAGSFGFQPVTVQARELEHELARVRNLSDRSAGDLGRAATLLEQLAALVAHV